MRILVTGGCGFIGSHLVKYLINETPHTILNIDKLTYAADRERLSSIEKSSRYKFMQLDISADKEVAKLVLDFEPDLIMNLAAESHVDNSISAPKQFLQTNTVGTFNLLEASRNYLSEKNKDRNSFRFHQVSTDEVYGDLYPLTENKTLVQRFDEQTSYSPSSPYSASKAAADHLVSSWGRTYKMQTLITTCSNNYGPFQHKEKLIPKVISKVLNNEPIPVYGDGQQIRDWLYVEDHVRALWAVAEGGVSGSTYAIGGSNEQKNIDVVRSLCGILDELCPGRDTHQRLIEFVDDRPGHDRHYAIDSSKIRKELGWHPRKNFNEGLRETVLSFLS